MHFKELPWDFFSKYSNLIAENEQGLVAFLTEDPFLEKITLDHIRKNQLNFSLYFGNEFSENIFEQKFQNLSFFSEQEKILILNAEQIPAMTIAKIREFDFSQTTSLLLLVYAKSNKQFTEFSKDKSFKSYHVELPRFWEGQKLLAFLAKEKGIQLPFEISKYILETREHTFESFDWILNFIQLNFDSTKIEIEQLKEWLERERFDLFDLADLYFQNKNSFLKVLLSRDLDFEWIRSVSGFMLAHISKVLNPESIRAKNKLSKYDQKILDLSEQIKRENLKRDAEFFMNLDLMAKSKDLSLKDHLRLEFFN